MTNFFDLTFEQLEKLLAELDPKPFRTDQVLKWVYVRGAADFGAMTDMPLVLREELSSMVELNPMREIERHDSDDGTVKFLHILEDGEMIESVIIPEEGHKTLCISTQTGCAMGCVFCETGRTRGGRDLTPGEILAQVVYAVRYVGDRLDLRNLVFMGMGEPLRNLESLLCSLEIILSDRALDFSPRRVTVSTCGWVPGVLCLAGAGLDVNLAVSLNATEDATRTKLMPVNRKYPIRELMKAVKSFPVKARRRITFEYVLIEGVNDTLEDAWRLAYILKGLPSKVNLIPCNDNRSGLKAPSPSRIEAFQSALFAKGVLTTVRKSRGQEIEAACGQLRAAAEVRNHG
ncbi:MAG: 23S rRNA (adenine(2503)-C(2))-methyltransferase RlmN [bacterium]|nr:23S rRNA (adenine(2503)-C(2))-methyltransferase RlmN [bacterium]MDT8396263.1 23S rRNA (adenine(2503)-C(2))-methyltransferase RlmN [bacterium]